MAFYRVSSVSSEEVWNLVWHDEFDESAPPDKAVVANAKEFEHHGYRFSIAQIEEIGLQQFWNQEAVIRSALEQQRETGQLAFAALFITDILEQSSVMLIVGDEQVIQRINQPTIKPEVFERPGIVSRKKQLLPYLTERLDEEATEAPSQRDEPLTLVKPSSVPAYAGVFD